RDRPARRRARPADGRLRPPRHARRGDRHADRGRRRRHRPLRGREHGAPADARLRAAREAVIEIRPTTSPDELRRAFVIWHYFGADPVADDVAEKFDTLLDGRMLAAWEGDEVVGGAGAFPFELSVPGGRRVRAGGVTVVGVLPTHR